MAAELLPEDLWVEIKPLLPEPRPRPKGGRKPVSNQAALKGIILVLRSGIRGGNRARALRVTARVGAADLALPAPAHAG